MKFSSSSRGVALVIVLGFLVILSGLALAFFSSVTTESKAARTYSSNISTRQLAESAVNVVMGQIREATTRQGGAWASQPGMIRVYRDGPTASPKVDSFFKLYSARNMVLTESQIRSGFDPSAAPLGYRSDRDGEKCDVPLDWNDYPALFTDLNSPVSVTDPDDPGGTPRPVFPIIDPRAKATVTVGGQAKPLIEGFDFTADVALAVAAGSPDDWRVPMPTRWIYMLRDGTLTTPNREFSPSGGGTGAEWTGSADFRTPTKENPIVGRMAFWADDDSSKVNINTAGGHGMQAPGGFDNGYTENSYAGSYWDTPRFNSNFDLGQVNSNDGTLLPNVGAGGLAAAQPAQKEFQRYPGHPATTSLGAVFSRLLTSEQIYKLVPRMNGGGSEGGTVRLERATAVEMALKVERLYASLDELLYAATPVRGGKRETNDEYVGVAGAITPEKLEKMKFFLTPHSRAPDLNLFGRPRVAIWPVNQAFDEASGRNGYDRAIAFCSTIGGKKFIFTRAASSSGALNPTADITSTAYSRNPELMGYLREVTSRAIPGFGGDFVTKYGIPNRDSILGQIFDYIRIANLRDTTTGMTTSQYAKFGIVAPSRADIFATGQKIGGFGRWSTISEASIVFYCSGVEAPGARKLGAAAGDPVIPAGVYQGAIHAEDRGMITHRYVRAFLILSTFSPMQGYAPIVNPSTNNEKQVYEITGLDGFKINGEGMSFPGSASNRVHITSGSTWAGRNFGGYEGFMHTLASHGQVESNAEAYKFQSGNGVKIAITNPTFQFSGGTINLKIKFGTHELQKIALKFPEGTWKVPERWYRKNTGGFLAAGDASYNSRGMVEMAQSLSENPNVPDTYDATNRKLPGRITWAMKDSNNPNTDPGNAEYYNIKGGDRWRQIIQPGDIVRSLVFGSSGRPAASIRDGDLRLLALMEDVPDSLFKKHPDYDDSNYRFAQGLRASDGNTYIFNPIPMWKLDAPDGTEGTVNLTETTAFGNHVNHATLRAATAKAMTLPHSQSTPATNPPNGGVNGVLRSDGRAGDFDTGLGVFADGPYAGKQDEGNVIFKYWNKDLQKWIYPTPYAGNQEYEAPGDIFFSPNRQMPSPGLFGSLLSRPMDTNPRRHWETLAFCPNTVGLRHPGNTVTPRDHLLLDLFTMPFVEPYLISEPLSTAGRVNLNYQIAPFSYIKRSTALRAALQSLRVTAVKTTLMGTYKTTKITAFADNPRLPIDRDETLKAFDAFFAQYKTDPDKGFFKSASEICERFLYPAGTAMPNFQAPVFDPVTNVSGEPAINTFWSTRSLTGDNVREKPYADLYPRVTTKSNTYTVHMRVQTVRQTGADGDFKKWREGRDVVLGEFRGATTIERFIDPSDPRLVQKITETDPTKQSLEDLYRMRVVMTKKFAP